MEAIITSVLGGLVSGLFTFLGVLLTIRHENKKARQEELKRQKEKEEELFESRPRFEIIEYKEISKYSVSEDVDISVLLCDIKDYKIEGRAFFYYDPDVIETEKWVSAEYTLKNIGHTEISHMFFSTNLTRNTSLFGVENGDNEECYKNNLLNYSVILDKAVKPKESIKLQVCYINEGVIASNVSATITIWMVDEKNNWWAQPLFAPYEEIYNSRKSSYKEWKDSTDESKAIKCFEDPRLW